MNVTTITCPKCGSINYNTSKFCTGCGSELQIFNSSEYQQLVNTNKDLLGKIFLPTKKL